MKHFYFVEIITRREEIESRRRDESCWNVRHKTNIPGETEDFLARDTVSLYKPWRNVLRALR
jgi:hypothetical protein